MIGRTSFRPRYHPVPGVAPPSRPAHRPALPKALLKALGARISEQPSGRHREPGCVNDVRTINLNDTLMNLNSPLFLPCSRPKQRSGHSDRLGDRRFQRMIRRPIAVFWRTDGLFRYPAGIENGA
jgi:hypothetical protein